MVPGSTLFSPVTGTVQSACVRRFGFALPACPESVARARHLTADRLTDWGLGEDVGFAASLVVSELVTNAVIHTGSARVLLELVDTEGRLRIAVRDEGIGPEGPRLRRTAQDAGEHGRGLVLVDGMCDAWGSQENGPESGRTVWAELPHGCGDLTADLTADLAADLTADSLLGSDDLVSAPPAVQGGALR